MDGLAEVPDYDLVTLAQRGLPDAYGELVRRYQTEVFHVIVAALSSSNSVARAISLLVVIVLLSSIAIGLTAVAELVGERLRLNKSTPFRNLLGGALLLEVAALVPIVGWFAVMPGTLLIGYGAMLIALVRRKPSQLPQNQTTSTTTLE